MQLERPPGDEMRIEADAADQHEHDRNRLDRGAVEESEIRVVRRVAAGRQSAEAVRDRVERAHAREPERERAERGEQHVKSADVTRRARDARREPLVLERPRRLGLVQLHAADAEHRQQCDREHDHAEPAEPLDLLAVEEDRRDQAVEAYEHARGRGRVARRGLEECVREAHAEGEHERHGADRAHRGPHHADDQKPVAAAHVDVRATERQPEHETREQRDGARGGEPPGLAVGIEKRDADRRQQRRAEQHADHAERAADHAEPQRSLSVGPDRSRHAQRPRVRRRRARRACGRVRRRRAAFGARAQDMQNAFSLLPSRSRK
jgi:hypothetical protein